VKQKTPANVRTANANVHVAKAENVHAKENAHAAADAKNNKKKANNQYPERYQLLTFYDTSIRNHRYNSSFSI
jgi:hypothetical protein